MSSPPTKRLRRTNQDVATFDDPFGDEDDFTQDDLDAIDGIASQAFTSASASEFLSKPKTKPAEVVRGSAGSSSGQSKAACRSTTNHRNALGLSSSNRGAAPNREPHGEFTSVISNVITLFIYLYQLVYYTNTVVLTSNCLPLWLIILNQITPQIQ